jgi:CubicO group peptidase (beta-lactamase class C family)
MSALDAIADWPVANAAAAVIGPSGVLAHSGDTAHLFPLASVTKPLVARAVQVAIEEGVIELETEAGPPASTMRHLLAHTAGYSMNSDQLVSEPGKRRVYSNHGFAVAAETLALEAGIEFGRYLAEAVFEPLGMRSSEFRGGAQAAGYGGSSTVADLALFAADLLKPALVSEQMHAEATSVQFPGLDGVLPGFGVQRPNDWGLGFEIRDGKSPHWTGSANSDRTYGHFGQSGTFLWVDPDLGLSLVALTDREFGDWTHRAWPALADAVIAEFGSKNRD